MPTVTIKINSNAFQVAEQLGLFETVLIPQLTIAMSESLDLLEQATINYMYTVFQDPQGDLESSFYQVVTPGLDNVTGELINPSAYAWRREKGFSGMTDSLGRFYKRDPGKRYMSYQLRDLMVLQGIQMIFLTDVAIALVNMGVMP